MKLLQIKTQSMYFTVGALLGWLAVILQFYLIIVNKTASLLETVIRFFSFFTVLTNILVAICFTSLVLLKPGSKSFFSSAKVHSAVCVYIIVVGLVYNLILRQLWTPAGLQQIVDEMLHSVIPLLFLFHWLAFVSKINLEWKLVPLWLVYPLIYIVFIIIRGSMSGFYPYPFVDVSDLGYAKVLMNSLYLCLGFSILSVLLIAVAKLSRRNIKDQGFRNKAKGTN